MLSSNGFIAAPYLRIREALGDRPVEDSALSGPEAVALALALPPAEPIARCEAAQKAGLKATGIRHPAPRGPAATLIGMVSGLPRGRSLR